MRRLYTIQAVKSNPLNSLFSCVFTATFTFLLFSVAGLQVQAQGFGVNKIKVQLSEKLPPAVYPAGTDIMITVTSQSAIDAQYLQQLQSNLKIALPRFDWRLNIVTDKPESVLSGEISDMHATSRTVTESRSVYKKVGEHGVTDPETGAFQVVEDFAYVTENFLVTRIEGQTSLRYQIRDELSGIILESSTLTTNFGVTYDSNVPSMDAVYKTMLDKLGVMLASRFGSKFNDPIIVNAPKGKLERVSNFLKDNMWSSAIEELNRVQHFKKPEDDAYRLYAFGLAYEGMAYGTADLTSSKNYMEQADSFYAQASRQNFDEADMQRAALRSARQVKFYKGLERAMLAYETKRQQKGLKLLEISKLQSYFGTTKITTNDTIIDWVKSGATEKEISKRLKTTRAACFDLSTSGMADLRNAGVKASSIDEMRKGMNPVQVRRKTRSGWLTYVYTYAMILSPFWFR